MRLYRVLSICWLALLLNACASTKVEPYTRPPPEFALPAARDGTFADIESSLQRAHGPEASGFALLDANEDGLRWRLALIDSAQHSIDMQYYLWYGDVAGKLLVKRLLDAADRGVKVRLLIDDLNTLLDAATVTLRDDVAAWVDAHPNLELRLFNPWRDRALLGRVGESVVEMERVNHRMHHKAMIVDNRVAILGGRNIGDDYFGLSHKYNFHDLDVIGFGPVARQTSTVFDRYWNSAWVMPVSALRLKTPPDRDRVRAQVTEELASAIELANFSVKPRSWSKELEQMRGRLHIGTSRVITDVPLAGEIRQEMRGELFEFMNSAKREVLIVNAYIILGERTIESLRDLNARGVTIKMLTNSLASHDVPAVNSHYKRWREPILRSGTQLYEMRHDAAIQTPIADTAPIRAGFMGLHSKAMLIDRQRAFIGSMNFDPRSAELNTEMGVIVDSPDLARALAAVIERDMQPVNAWRVELDQRTGDLRWTNDRETVVRQPARSWWQRVEDIFFMAFPENLY